jgi:hypothetical protein
VLHEQGAAIDHIYFPLTAPNSFTHVSTD